MKKTNSKGQSLLEVIIALGLFAIAAGTVFILLGSQFKSLEIVRDGTQAISLAEEGLEAVRTIRDRDWDELDLGNHGLKMAENKWAFEGESDISNDGYSRSVSVSEISANEKLVTSTVTWTPSYLRNQTITLTSILSNWRNLAQPLLSGDWTSPQTLGSIQLGSGKTANGLAVRNSLVYIAASASSSAKDDFFVIDATVGWNPIIRGYTNTGPGLNSVVISGDYAYVSNRDNNAQLQVLNIANPDNPFLVSSTKLTGNSDIGQGIAVSGNYVYIGTEKDSGKEFFVVDVANPANPIVRGSLEIDGDVNDIFVFGERVFLATSKDSGEFIVINATDPLNPVQTAAIDILGNSEEGMGIYVNSQDNRAYLARSEGGGHDEHHEIAIVNVTNADAPNLLGSLNFEADVNGIFAADNLAFLATGEPNQEFQIFEVSDPQNMTYYSGLNFPEMATDIAFENNVIYVSVRSNDHLRIITSQ